MDAPHPEKPAATRSSTVGRSGFLAVLLQCLPLLFTGGCITSTFGPAAWSLNAPGNKIQFIFGLFVLAWGLGYAYLRQSQRFVLAFCGGLVLTFLAWWLNIVLLNGCIDLGTSQRCPQRVRIFDRPFAVLTVAVFGVWVLLYAYDAFTLARALRRGDTVDQMVGSRILRNIAVSSTVIGIIVFAFYMSPYCSQLWERSK